MRAIFCSSLLLLLAPALGWAAGDESVEDLKQRNHSLEKRVQKLENANLSGAIEEYLSSHEASGADSILPGGISIRFSGQVRVRGEIQDRLYSPADPAGERSFDLVHMRTRLRVDVDVTEVTGVVIELQDIRDFGEEKTTIGDLEGVDIKRATILIRKVGDRPLMIELGRFVMHYGDQRVIGHLEWFDQGRSYDGIRARYQPEKWWLDVFAVRVRETTPPVMDDDQWFAGVYAGCDWAEAYALLFADDMAMAGETTTDDTRFLTLGFRVHRKSGNWDYSGEFTFQTGDVKGDDLSAFGFAVVGGYTFADATWKPRVGIEVDFATGDEDPTDGDQGTLQTLFPTNHLHYGFADLVGWSNLLNLKLSVQASPSERVTITLDFHHLRRVEERGAWINAGGAVIRGGAIGSDEHLGDEVDITVVWKARKGLVFLVGYSIFAPGGFVEETGDDPLAHFFYLQTTVTF